MSYDKVQFIYNAFQKMGAAISTKLNITGLNDTPSGYLGHSGDYLVVNDGETGIHFTGIEKIASDLTDYGFGGSSSDIPKYTDLPDATDNDGKIVASGCELYHSCDGEWTKIIKQDTITTLPPGESDGLPGCVATLEDKTNYIIYRDEVINENASNQFSLSLQGLTPQQLHETCLFTEFQGIPDDSIKLKFSESDYKWAIAPDGSLLHPQIYQESPTASQVFTLNNANAYNEFNPESMPALDEYINYPSQITDMHFSEDGLRAIGFGYQSLYVHEYLFTEPYDLSSATRSRVKAVRSTSTDDFYSNLAGRKGVVKTDDPSIVYVVYNFGIERKTLGTPGDLYSITTDNDWYARSWGNYLPQNSYFGYYNSSFNQKSRYWIGSMDFTNNGNTLVVLFLKSRYQDADPNDKNGYLVSYDLSTPYLLPGNMPFSPSNSNQVVDELMPEPSAVVDLDSFGIISTLTSSVFGGAKYVFISNSISEQIVMEMAVPGDLNTIFVKGEIQANPAVGITDNKFSPTSSLWPKNNLDLYIFSKNYKSLVSSTLSSPRGQLDESSCQFVEWKTSDQNLISNKSSPSNAKITLTQDLSITGVFNCS